MTTASSNAAPIGIFDSGVGGLTVARAVADQLPAERLRYVGDTLHAPYGPLPIARVRELALRALDGLVADGVKALVGLIGTEGTVRSRAYDDALAATGVRLSSVACPRFVEFVERGVTSGRQILGLAQGYLEPLTRADVDTLILGCTHYPLLTGVLQTVMGPDVTLVSSAEETAKDVVRVLTELDLLADRDEPPEHEFIATGPAEPFTKLARRFMGLGTVLAAT